MEDKQFEVVINKLDDLISDCIKVCVRSKNELGDIKLSGVISKIEKAKELYSTMDKIFNNELYHIIGMGDLTDEQMLLFTDRVRMFAKFRPYLKPLSCAVINIPKIPEYTDYTCSTLGGIKLVCNMGDNNDNNM